VGVIGGLDILPIHVTKSVFGPAYQGKDIVFRFIIEYCSLRGNMAPR
jgi:hypothetical protein